MTAHTHQLAPIPGVVDAELITAHDHDGNAWLHLFFILGPRGERAHVELLLSSDDARALQSSLQDGARGAGDPLPCRVGFRLGHVPS